MYYNVNGQNMLNWFYSILNPSNDNIAAPTTNFNINGLDLSNNYIGIGTNSNIPVSQVHTINYFSNGVSIGNLFELNLPVFSGTRDVHYKIWSPSQHDGLLIQFLQNTSIKFNYTISGKFLAVGGGGGGGGSNQSNAGGGGGGGGVVTGSILNAVPGIQFNITIGNGGASGAGSVENQRTGGNGGPTTITYDGISITASGGGGGGQGKGNGSNATNASSGGGGSFSNTGTVSQSPINDSSLLTNRGVFTDMSANFNIGTRGNEQNNETGGGGGGGGAGAPAQFISNGTVVHGGSGITVTFGTTYITSITVGGGGGGGGRQQEFAWTITEGGFGGSGGGGKGGTSASHSPTAQHGSPGFPNTGGGGGGGSNIGGNGGSGGSGTVFFYILPSGVSN